MKAVFDSASIFTTTFLQHCKTISPSACLHVHLFYMCWYKELQRHRFKRRRWARSTVFLKTARRHFPTFGVMNILFSPGCVLHSTETEHAVDVLPEGEDNCIITWCKCYHFKSQQNVWNSFCLAPAILASLSLSLREPVVMVIASKSQHVGSLWLKGLYKAR